MGSRFVVMGDGDTVVLKRIAVPEKSDLRAMLGKVRARARRAGIIAALDPSLSRRRDRIRLGGVAIPQGRTRACVGAALALAVAVSGCHEASESGGPPPATCIEVRGTWDITVDLDPANPGTSLCREVWPIGQDGCTIVVPLDPSSCSPCFLVSPLCWGAAGSAPSTESSLLTLRWSFTGGDSCKYDAELQATVDGATLTGTILLEQQWAPGGNCTGYLRAFGVTGTRRLAGYAAP